MSYCERCDRSFNSGYALWRHRLDSPHHWICHTCDKDFTTWNSLHQHYTQSPRHDYCRFCEEDFDSGGELNSHYHEYHYPCKGCNEVFDNELDCHEHGQQSHPYCIPCRRAFLSKSNLVAHLNSSVHKSKDFVCPGKDCGRGFVSKSALLLHFEGGKCPSGITREKLNQKIVQLDRNNLITNPARLIAGPRGYESPRVTETWATERSWNGSAYECVLCHRQYRTLHSLNAHLKSPRHQDKIYRCPNRTSCGSEFSALSSLTQHIESEKCGVIRFGGVQSAMDSLLGGMRRLTV